MADWGVGDDVFDHMPRNRFSRAAEGPPRDRRFASRPDGAEPRAADEQPAAEGERRSEDDRRAEGAEPAGGERRGSRTSATEDAYGVALERWDTPTPEVPRGRVDDGRRTIVIGRPEDVPSEIAAITADRDLGEDEPAPAEPAPAEPYAGTGPRAPGERRTVRIAGRPEGSLEAARFHREHARRPSRTAHERVGARPDRLAMWAFALGMLLILIALLSAT